MLNDDPFALKPIAMTSMIPRKRFLVVMVILADLAMVAQTFASDVKYAVARPESEFRIFQFPKDKMPRIDGDTSDWQMVPESYVYDSSWISDTMDGHDSDFDRNDLDVKVTVGWVKGLNRLYFRYEAHDDFWDFGRFNPQNYMSDIFEISVDGDMSGGPFIFNPLLGPLRQGDRSGPEFQENFTRFSGNHAQNYHIFTPPVRNAWAMVWGGQPWIAEFPYANYAYEFDFKPGEEGKLVMEFWITPFDYAPIDGPERSVESRLEENRLIGLAWSILDFDGDQRDGHYNLAHDTRMVRDATYLCAFRLMPMEPRLLPDLYAEWSFKVIDHDRRVVAFRDESIGDLTSWKWDFGDGHTSTEQHPIHAFGDKGVRKIVSLEVRGPKGVSYRTRYREVLIK